MAKQIKSRDRVVDHGEVFTNEREVNAMLDMVASECERIESRFLEPACGDGNFLAEVLRRKPISSDRIAVCFDNDKKKKIANSCSRRPSTRGCCSYEIRRRHQVDTRGAGPLTAFPCSRSRSHPAGARPAPEVEDYESRDLMPDCRTAWLYLNLVPKKNGNSIKIEG